MISTPRVLLAEDDDDLREALAEALRGRGFEVIEAASGQAVEQYLDDCVNVDVVGPRVHVLVADLCMPGTDGLQLIDRLGELGWDLPTIVITAFPDPDIRTLLLEKGALRVLEKPVDLDALERTLHEALRRNPDVPE